MVEIYKHGIYINAVEGTLKDSEALREWLLSNIVPRLGDARLGGSELGWEYLSERYRLPQLILLASERGYTFRQKNG